VRRAAHIFLEVCVAGASECVNTSVSADSVLNEATDLFNLLIKSAAVSSSPRLQHVISVRYRAVVSSFSFAVAQTSAGGGAGGGAAVLLRRRSMRPKRNLLLSNHWWSLEEVVHRTLGPLLKCHFSLFLYMQFLGH